MPSVKDTTFNEWLESLSAIELRNIFDNPPFELAQKVWDAAREADGWERPKW